MHIKILFHGRTSENAPSSKATFSKVEATSCCKAAAAVFESTAVLLLYSKKHTSNAAASSLSDKALE